MKLIIDIDDNDYELINKTGITLDLNTAFHGKEKDKEMTFAVFGLVKALKNGTPYEERPQGEWARHDEWRGGEYIGGFYHVNCPCEDGYYSKWETNFCPNCGQPMKKGGE